ncbi:hypothetical protein Tco_1054361 [Tanacetum coccineum]|uniref:Uncharacterized protein n=1 Tax=Tanacetum coccineum TaxID=301880 RepID=A0ABQ5GWY9_9ASTR
MASMNTRLNIEKLDGNIIQKHEGSKQVGFKQLGPGVETGVHEVHDEKRVWFEVELQGAQGDREAEVFQVSNDDTIVAQTRLEDKQPEEKTDCLVKEQEKVHHGTNVGAVIMKTGVPGQEGAKGNVAEGYREDNKEAAFAVAAVDKIYAHESLTFNDTVACSVRCIIRDQIGNTLRVSWSRIHNEKLVQIGSQEYQVVCTRPDIASVGVDMLDGFDRGSLKANLQYMEALSTTEARYMTFTEA